MAELGKIEKLEVSEFKEGKKLFLVPLISPVKEPPAYKKEAEDRSPKEEEEVKLYSQYKERFDRYWDEAQGQIDKLEAKLGEIKRIYYE
jgi:hypothetical protein